MDQNNEQQPYDGSIQDLTLVVFDVQEKDGQKVTLLGETLPPNITSSKYMKAVKYIKELGWEEQVDLLRQYNEMRETLTSIRKNLTKRSN
jgi:hypothetical protein